MEEHRSKRATLSEVAHRAGVSVMTASYTFGQPDRVSESARARVHAAAAALGYAGPDPRARSLRRGKVGALGVVLGEHLGYAFDDPGAVSFLSGVAQVCADQGYALTIVPIGGAADDPRRVAETAVDGFIVWTTSDDDPVLDAVLATRRPAVIHGGPARDGLELVSIDNRAAAAAVGAAAFTGSRLPAVLSQPLDRDRVRRIGSAADLGDVRFPVTRARLAGYRDAAVAAGTAWDDVVVGVCSRNDPAEAERMAYGMLSADEPPDAIAAMSDQQAAGVVRAARAAGRRIPEDLVVTGWDDLPLAAELDLTTVSQSLRTQGAECARIALGQEPDAAPSWTLVKRGSTR